jgi:predicted pyridoxine 5'-phosphate oxidase superfamily flavin-nucleotide-binding protein
MNTPDYHMRNQSEEVTPIASPFHEGEQVVQTRHGVRDEAEQRGRKMIATELSQGHRDFFGQLPLVVTSSLDDQGQPWAGLLSGDPGFIQAPLERANELQFAGGNAGAPAQPDPRAGSSIGLLGIDLERRRRNRVNGTALESAAGTLALSVDQAFGNCPKYITKRPWPAELLSGSYSFETSANISARAATIIDESDTFFIASSSGPAVEASQIAAANASRPDAWGADVSHRGGEPGFLEQVQNTLWFDDYAGNNLFNTLGNLHRYPRCGLLIIDFKSGEVLQIAATAELHHDGAKFRVAAKVNEVRHWRPAMNS